MFKQKSKKMALKVSIILLTIILTLFYYLVGIPLFGLLLLHRYFVIYLAKWRHNTWLPTGIVGGIFSVNTRNENKVNAIGFSVQFENTFDYTVLMERIEAFLQTNAVIYTLVCSPQSHVKSTESYLT
jgi:hypothetical protein